ncbi:TlpA family protein disulfide reductase [Alkalibacillus haloalkaliphilus]|uniref:TlpA family protein disulfide reductase n=1 Tax=Alkalibacillus haloalkaliphilus TaxID=94136 RepID=UPI002936BACF|nr:redoxin domain-containing protein [Alkalibacillus haloalkaliphilus]MDV2580704.1 redoxin domain-containing protein [Alkalibacillus haloalkaliphilus]
MLKRILGLAIIGVLLGIIVYNTWFDDTANGDPEGDGIFVQPDGVDIDTDGVEVGDMAPNFKLQTLNGEEAELADFRGQKVMINFWATWCPPCRAEMPHMQEIHEEYDDDVVILAVNATSQETSHDNVQDFIDELELTFPILMDETGEVNVRYQALSLPTTYFVNTEGELQIPRHVGPLSYDDMVRKIEELD